MSRAALASFTSEASLFTKTRTSLILAVGAAAALLAFQNCSPASVKFSETTSDSSSSVASVAPSTASPVETFTWSPGLWTNCSVACGPGTQTRGIACVDSHGRAASDQQCQSVPKPSSTQACTQPTSGPCVTGGQAGNMVCDSYGRVSCVAPNLTAGWVSGAWSSCSATCGGGTQTRTNTCVSTSSGQSVSAANCPNTPPATTQACNQQACPVQACSNGLKANQQCAKADGSPQDASAPSFGFLGNVSYSGCKDYCRSRGNLCVNFVLDQSISTPSDQSVGICTCEPLSRTTSAPGHDGLITWATVLCPSN